MPGTVCSDSPSWVSLSAGQLVTCGARGPATTSRPAGRPRLLGNHHHVPWRPPSYHGVGIPPRLARGQPLGGTHPIPTDGAAVAPKLTSVSIAPATRPHPLRLLCESLTLSGDSPALDLGSPYDLRGRDVQGGPSGTQLRLCFMVASFVLPL